MPTPEEIKAASDAEAFDKKNAAQLAADQKAQTEAQTKVPVVVSGDAVLGGPANIYGDHFGPRGVLSIGGREIQTPLWEDKRIHFVLAPGTRGAVVLTTSSGVRHGVFPHVAPVVTETTTVTVKTA